MKGSFVSRFLNRIENSRFSFAMPLFKALCTFVIEPEERAHSAPFIRDAIDIKRVMILVVYALLPCLFMAIINTGLQTFIYSSSPSVMLEYIEASKSLSTLIIFIKNHCVSIVYLGLKLTLPIILAAYIGGGIVEVLFALIRRHEISEGYLVTGLLYGLILPSTIPLWMVVIGSMIGILIGKEVFGGTGMNIFNPALVCRCFLYFTFPAMMSGSVWVGENSVRTTQHIIKLKEHPKLHSLSQDSWLAKFNISLSVKRIHIAAIESCLNYPTSLFDAVDLYYQNFMQHKDSFPKHITKVSVDQLKNFVTSSTEEGGLGLNEDLFREAYEFTLIKHGDQLSSNMNLFFGNRIGSIGETSILACLLGAFLLLLTQIASWRTMLAVVLGASLTAILFELGSHIGIDHGAWNPAKFSMPFYKHLLVGGLAFGVVFMATDPVSSPTLPLAKWLYGIVAGVVTIIVRVINPAFPEGVMLAILFGNAFAPLFDQLAVRRKRGLKSYGN